MRVASELNACQPELTTCVVRPLLLLELHDTRWAFDSVAKHGLVILGSRVIHWELRDWIEAEGWGWEGPGVVEGGGGEGCV